MTGNFGVGAEIAGAVKNPHGLLYISRVANDATFYVVRLMKAEGQYGLQLWGEDESGFDDYAAIPADELAEYPDLAELVHESLKEGDFGTQVIFYGQGETEDTAAGKTSQWVGKAVALAQRNYRVIS